MTALVCACMAQSAVAQSGDSGVPPAPVDPNAGPKPTPTTPPVPPTAPPQELAPVQITGARPDEVRERRESTAAKIVIGREEIERFGDTTLGDVLQRLPGVTIQGRPGSGGAIRLRGLGNGYTQILLDGERVPRGFSLDSLTPDQIERIEVLRAPTAETGARAIAGTINIVMRQAYRKPVNDLRLQLRHENGVARPSGSWTRNIVAGDWTVNYSLSVFSYGRDTRSSSSTVDTRLSDSAVTLAQFENSDVRVRGKGVTANARLQWGASGSADVVTLTPFLYTNSGRSESRSTLQQPIGALPAPYDASRSENEFPSTYARLNAQWNHRLESGGRLEWRAGVGQSLQNADSARTETTGGAVTRTLDERSDSRDRRVTASGKLVRSIFDEHSLVAGAEVEAARRTATRSTVQNGVPLLTGFDDESTASTTRFAAYAQDEWDASPNWAFNAGLRWEGIDTRGSVEQGQPDVVNRSSVWTPLLHAVWKPDAKGRDQVRLGLTRSYRTPGLGDLIARPTLNTRYPIPGPNTPTQPDRAGNPDLKPELATGVDLAFEHYLPGSGVLSANVFHRDISGYMRSVTTLENVSYSNVPRYVLRQQNVGKAVTQGLELEAKFRLSDVFPAAPRVDVRSNVSIFRSRVKDVQGPDNRLDQQPDYTANVGFDHRLRGLPLTFGGNLNWTPGYTTRLSDTQTASIGRRFVTDAYALWTFNPAVALRLTASNIAAQQYVFGGTVVGPDLQGTPVSERSETASPTYVNVQLRLELKL